jgi:hypothetical protein
MAEMLKRLYDLVVLKVSLDTSREPTRIRSVIEAKLNGEPQPIAEWEFTAQEMGLPERIDRRQALYGGYSFTIPSAVVSGLKERLAREITTDTPLWLHLERPSGYLDMVPWERLLLPEIGSPMLRLPDFVVQPARETPNALDVLLCSSAPTAKEGIPLVDHLVRFVAQLQSAVTRRVHFHVFTDAARQAELVGALSARGLNSAATVYPAHAAVRFDVPEADTIVSDPGSRLTNPWLLWMREALGGRSVDVAHFLCHGYLSGDRGALALAESPLKNSDRRMARFVGVPELRTFLTQVGAWSAIFSSPENNYSEMGLRRVADTIGQSRPGPLVHHDVRLDPNGDALAGAYRLLYNRTAQPPPVTNALFIYCQPFRVQVGAAETTRSGRPPSPDLDHVYDSSENVPAWVAASERYLEECEVRVQKLQPSRGERRSASDVHDRAAASLEGTLKEIRDVIARVATSSRTGGGQ